MRRFAVKLESFSVWAGGAELVGQSRDRVIFRKLRARNGAPLRLTMVSVPVVLHSTANRISQIAAKLSSLLLPLLYLTMLSHHLTLNSTAADQNIYVLQLNVGT